MTQEEKIAIVKKNLAKELDAEGTGEDTGAVSEMEQLVARDTAMQSVAEKLNEEHPLKKVKFGDLTLEWESKTEKKD